MATQLERYNEILTKLTDLQQNDRESGTGNHRQSPLAVIDPTANVISLVNLEVKRLNDLREMGEKFQDKLQTAESKRIDAQALAESRRVDAIIAAAANAVTLASTRAELTATALAERVDTSAKALAESVVQSAKVLSEAAARTEATNQAAIKALEQAQIQRLGADLQVKETKTDNRWTTQSVLQTMGVSIAMAVFLYKLITGH